MFFLHLLEWVVLEGKMHCWPRSDGHDDDADYDDDDDDTNDDDDDDDNDDDDDISSSWKKQVKDLTSLVFDIMRVPFLNLWAFIFQPILDDEEIWSDILLI